MSEALKALGEVWGDIPSLSKDAKNPHFNSKFVSLPNIVEALRPILAKAGVYYIQKSVESERGIGLNTVIVHAKSGNTYDAGTIYMPVDKGNAQGVGSAMTYARRYALCAVFGIVADEDDDGNRASQKPTSPTRAVPPADKQWEKEAKGALKKWTGMRTKADLLTAWGQVMKKLEIADGDVSDDAMRKAHAFITTNITAGADFLEVINAG